MTRWDAKAAALGMILMLTAGCVGLGASPPQDSALSAASVASSSSGSPALAPVLAIIAYTLVTTPSAEAPGGAAWVGLGGPIDGFVNPTLRVPHGASLHVIVRNGYGEAHGFGVLDSSGRSVAGWAPNVTGFGNETDLWWDDAPSGLYTYECPNSTHAMRGFVLVEGTAGARTAEPPASPPVVPPGSPSSGSKHEAHTTEGALTISEEFSVGSTSLTVASSSAEPIGTIDEPVEMAAPPARARTAWNPDEWVLEVPIRTVGPAPGEGVFVASLDWDGEFAGEIYFVANKTAGSPGSVVASFALGLELNTSAAFVLKIERMGDSEDDVEAGDSPTQVGSSGPSAVTFTLVSKTDSFSTWIGVGNETDGKTNPTFRVRVGQVVTIIAKEGPTDTEAHNIGIRSADKKMVTRWSADIVLPGDTVKLTWRPTAPGTYTYVCKYHDKTQKGSIIVTG